MDFLRMFDPILGIKKKDDQQPQQQVQPQASSMNQLLSSGPQINNRGAVNLMLDKGESYENIANKTGVALNDVRKYADFTRPGYGVKTNQPQSLFDNTVTRGFNNFFVKPLVETTQKAANTVGAGVTGLVGLGQAGVQRLFGDEKSSNNTLQATQSAVDSVLSHGFGEQGAFLTPQQARGGNIVEDFAKPMLSASAEIAPYGVPIAKGANLLLTSLKQGATNGGVLALSNAMKQYGDTSSIDPVQTGKAAVFGLAGGAAMPVASAVARAGGRMITNSTNVKPVFAATQDILDNSSVEIPQKVTTDSMLPAYVRQGKELNGPEPVVNKELNIPQINDTEMRLAFSRPSTDVIKNNPDVAQSFLRTGSKDSLTLTLDMLANSDKKASIRSAVSRLLPNVDNPTKNALTKTILRENDPEAIGKLLWDVKHATDSGFTYIPDVPSPRPIVDEKLSTPTPQSNIASESIPLGINVNDMDVPAYIRQRVNSENSPSPIVQNTTAQNSIPNQLPSNANVNTEPLLTARNPLTGETVTVNQPRNAQAKSTFASRTIPQSELVSDELKQSVQNNAPSYQKQTEAERFATTAERMGKQGEEQFATDVLQRLDAPKGKINSQDAADALTIAAKLDEKGDTASLQQATYIYEKLASHFTAAGQLVQAAAILSRRSPEGLRFSVTRSFKKAGKELTPEQQTELNGLIEKVRDAKVGTNERARAAYDVSKFVTDNIPSSFGDKVIGIWRTGLLTAPTTTTGNLLANTGEAIVRKGLVNPIATAADAAFGLFTGKRTKTMAGGFGKGAIEGAGKLPEYMKTGFDERNALAKYDTQELNYGNGIPGKILNTYTRGVGRLMSVADQPYWYGARNEALASMAKAEALTRGLRGAEKKQFINDFINNPSQDAIERATQEAQYATFQNETALGNAASGMKNRSGALKPVLDFFVPFTRVPAAVATRIVQRTPISIGIQIVKQVVNVCKGRQFDQRAMAQAIGEGLSGTAIFAAGYSLANSGMLTFGYPTDPKERAIWDAEGKQPYSVKVGDRWYSLNYLQPFGTLLAIGGQSAKDVKNGANATEAIGKAVAVAGQSVTNQSFLKGISGALDAISDPEISAEKYINNSAASVVPNIIRSFARSQDPTQRDEKGIVAGIKQGIPGLRETTAPKLDMFGNPLPAKDNFVNQFINPLRPSIARNTDPVTSELDRLVSVDKGVMPTQATATAFKDVKLTDQQVRDINQEAGPKLHEAYLGIINDPRYVTLSEDDKVKAFKKANDTVFGAIKAKYGVENGLIEANRKLTDTNQKRYLSGQNVDYVSQLTDDSKKTNKEKYDEAKQEYFEKRNRWSDVEQLAKSKELAQLKVKSDFSNDVTELYGMNKEDAIRFLENNGNADAIKSQLLAYGDALAKAGLSKNKFRDKYGNENFVSKSNSKKAKRKATFKVPAPKLSITESATRSRQLLSSAKVTRRK